MNGTAMLLRLYSYALPWCLVLFGVGRHRNTAISQKEVQFSGQDRLMEDVCHVCASVDLTCRSMYLERLVGHEPL